MEKDNYITDVVFRVDTTGSWKGTVFAMLPHECSDYKGNVTCYQHVGQHSSADYHGCVAKSRLATETEYADLKREMENIGYVLKVIKKQDRHKFLVSYREVTNPKLKN